MHILNKIFAGSYNFKRIISTPNLTFNGKAEFIEKHDNNLLYQENGNYILNGNSYDFFRQCYYIIDKDKFEIYKILKNADRQLLHNFILESPVNLPMQLIHIHECLEDRYFLKMNLISENEFNTEYVITGPKKNQTIRTYFRR